MKRLSVALCTYNGDAHLADQLESLRRQERVPAELVVGDDGSPDRNAAILAQFAERDPFPVRLSVGRRVGASANFERTLLRCEGDAIALCDQDDLWHPHRLTAGEAKLERVPAALLAFGDAYLIGPHRARLAGSLWASLGVGRHIRRSLGRDPLATLLRRPVVTGCTVTLRRELLDLAVPFPTQEIQHDRWLALCAAARGPLAAVAERHVDYRLHAGQHTGLGPLSTRSRRARGRLPPSRRPGPRRRDDRRLEPLLTQVEELAARLDAGGRDQQAMDTLADCRRLLELRGSLPRRRTARVVPVVSHLAAGRYRRFSTGWVGATVDLLRP